MNVRTAARDLDRERAHLVKAGTAVMRRNGFLSASITEILEEADISTRAFYRHFRSKDDLLIAVFREQADRTRARLVERVEQAATPLDKLITWIDEVLDMGYDPRRGRISRLFASHPVRAVFVDAGHEATARLYEPLEAVLAQGLVSGDFPRCDPQADAGSIHALTWRLFTDAMFDRATLTRDDARDHVLRYVIPALGIER